MIDPCLNTNLTICCICFCKTIINISTKCLERNVDKVWIKIFPHKPVTKTPAETRMGKGKGALEYWVAVVKPGRVMFELLQDHIHRK